MTRARAAWLCHIPRWALLALLLACIGRLWLMPLPSSFWVDEMVTRFVVEQGGAHPSLAVAPQVPQSIYYLLPAGVARLWGSGEVAYRLPSVLAMAGALYFIARLAARLLHRRAAWFAVFACLALRGVNYQAGDARPYALATLVAAAGSWALVAWLDRGRWREAALFAVCGSLLWRVHLIDWPFYLVWACYAAWRVGRGESRIGWLRCGAIFTAIGVALLPVALKCLELAREASAHVITTQPRGSELGGALKPGLVLGALAGAALLARWQRWRVPRLAASAAGLVLVLGWWLIHPLCLFAYSRITGNSVFIDRYLFISLPGAALTATFVVALFLPPAFWRAAALVLGLGVLLFLGRWNHLWPPHHNSDWRAAAAIANHYSTGAAMPVLCPSPFIEARWPEWRPDYPLPGFLYAHLPVYPLRGQPYLLPHRSSPEAEAFAAELARRTLARSSRFVILGGDRNVWFWREWFRRCPELSGWTVRKVGSLGDVELAIFEKTTALP